MAKNKLTPLGEALNYFQIELAYSNYRLSCLTGIDAGAITRHKQGANITLTTLETYAFFLKIKLSDIFLKMEEIENKQK